MKKFMNIHVLIDNKCQNEITYISLIFHMTNPRHAQECHVMRGWGGQLIILFSRLENHLQYDSLSALSSKNTRIVKWNSIFFMCATSNHATKKSRSNVGSTVLLRLIQTWSLRVFLPCMRPGMETQYGTPQGSTVLRGMDGVII